MENAAEAVKKADAKPVTKKFEPVYTVAELVKAAKAEFNTSSIVVRAALKKAGQSTYTMAEARKVIDKMKSKEVKD